MRYLLIAVALLILVGCNGVNKLTYEAAQATHDAVAPEWETMFREKFKDAPDKIKRREILLEEWKAWIKALKDASESP